MNIRAKRVSGPLDDRVKARLRGDGVLTPTGYASSSGSEHDAEEPLFSGPIHAFLDIDHHDHDHDTDSVSDDVSDAADSGGGDCDAAAAGKKAIQGLLERSRRSDPFLVSRLHRDVTAAAAGAGGMKRSVMARLREYGHNAGICKARWESSGSSLSAGSYEYIDVVGVDGKERYIVDVEFAAEFEVARATEEYAELVAALPGVVVGRGEDVRQVVMIMAEAASRSMRRRGLSVPPWRKRRYMLAKWFGPYRRTTNAPTTVAVGVGVGEMMKCRRAAGFAVAPASASERNSSSLGRPLGGPASLDCTVLFEQE